MQSAEAVLSVKFQSSFDPGKLMRTCSEDLDLFRKVPGLIQKYYLSEPSTGAISGIYIFEDKAARIAFRESDLAKGIPVRYGVIPESLRVEQFDMAIVLNDEVIASGNIARGILERHLNAFLENDLPRLMTDYTEESVLITQDATFSGLKEIEGFFTGLMVHFPRHQSSFELDKMEFHEETAFIVWHGRTPSVTVPMGSDTFTMKDGKIHRQTFVGQLDFVQ